jgi:hypothetical protein
MPHDIRQQISMLVKLQDVELKIQQIEQELGKAPGRAALLDAQLNEFVSAVESGKANLQELTKRIRTLESDLQLNQGRVVKSQEKLRSVKTNKEYQSGLKEIDDLAAIASRIEDEILAAMEQVEAATAAIREHQARFDAQAGLIRAERNACSRRPTRPGANWKGSRRTRRRWPRRFPRRRSASTGGSGPRSPTGSRSARWRGRPATAVT